MALQEFTDITGSQTWFDPDALRPNGKKGVVYTQGGTNATDYGSPNEWNARQQQAHPERIKGAGNANPEKSPSNAGTGTQDFSGISGQPTIDLNKIYESATNTPDIQRIKGELETKRTAYTTAISKINDNPFYSEATRTGKLAKLQETALNEIRDLETQLSSRMADAQTQINIATEQYNIDDQRYKDNLSRLNMLIDTGALSNVSGAELAQLATSTGLTTSMLQGIKQQMGQTGVDPQVITNTDDEGNVNVSIIDKGSGNIVSSQSLGKVGKSTADKTDSTREAAFYSAIDSGVAQLQSGVPWGTVWNRIRLRFPEVNDNAIDTMLGKENWYEAGSYEKWVSRPQE